MKKLVLVLFLLGISSVKAQIEIGLGSTLYLYDDDIPTIGEFKTNFYLGKNFSISPSINVIFFKGKYESLLPYLDVHYNFHVTDKVSIYPLVGVGLITGYFIFPFVNAGVGSSYEFYNRFKLYTEINTINGRGISFNAGFLYVIKKKMKTHKSNY